VTGPTRHDHSNTDHQRTNVVVVVVHPPALSERTLIQRRILPFLLRRPLIESGARTAPLPIIACAIFAHPLFSQGEFLETGNERPVIRTDRARAISDRAEIDDSTARKRHTALKKLRWTAEFAGNLRSDGSRSRKRSNSRRTVQRFFCRITSSIF